MTTWYEQLRRNPDLYDIENWGHLDPEGLTDRQLEGFLKNRAIVAAVLEGHPENRVAEDHFTQESWVTYLLDRCLASPDGESPPLLNGLVPNRNVNGYRREKPPKSSKGSKGMAGAFQWLLEHVDGLQDHLDSMILADLRDSRTAERLTPRGLHRSFLRYLIANGVKATQYPFISKTKGYNSIRRYLRKRRIELAKYRSEEAEEKVRYRKQYRDELVPYDEAEFDEHKIDVFAHLPVDLQISNTQIIRLPRIWILAGVDRASTACLGYTFGLTKEIDSMEYVACLDQVSRLWEPMELTIPGLRYKPGAGFPSGVIEGCRYAIPMLVRADNAWAHYSLDSQHGITHKYGGIHNRGVAGSASTRSLIERFFNVIELELHRLPSSAGTGPQDPRREARKNFKMPPVISLRDLQELIEVIIANYNATPRADLGGRSPLQVIEDALAAGYRPIRVSPEFREAGGLFTRHEEVTVRGQPDKGISPHINFLYARYRGAPINTPDAIGEKVTIQYDCRDVRDLTVIAPTGQVLGKVHVQGLWSTFHHSEADRLEKCREHKELRYADFQYDAAGIYLENVNEGTVKPMEALNLLQRRNSLPDNQSTEEDEEPEDRNPQTRTLWQPRTTWQDDD